MNKRLLILGLIVTLLGITFSTTSAQSTSKAVLYQVWDTGGRIGWFNAPKGATTYRCTLYVQNIGTGDGYWVYGTNGYFVNPNDMLFDFDFDFRNGLWDIVGNPYALHTSACEALTNTWGYTALFEKTSRVNFLEQKLFVPVVMR